MCIFWVCWWVVECVVTTTVLYLFIYLHASLSPPAASALQCTLSYYPVMFSLLPFPRWYPDWYDGEKGPVGGGSHQSSRTRTKARIQIPTWWESDRPRETKEQLISFSISRHLSYALNKTEWNTLHVHRNPLNTPRYAFPFHGVITSCKIWTDNVGELLCYPLMAFLLFCFCLQLHMSRSICWIMERM